MAAVKMAGLEVTPSRPSSLTILASSPDVISPRRMLSYQMLCPYFLTSITRLDMVTPPVSAADGNGAESTGLFIAQPGAPATKKWAIQETFTEGSVAVFPRNAAKRTGLPRLYRL